MTNEMRIWAAAGLALLATLVALVALPQIDTRTSMERAQERLEQGWRN